MRALPALIVVLCVTGCQSNGTDTDEVVPAAPAVEMDPQAYMEILAEKGSPGIEHRRLRDMIGTWDCTVRSRDTADSEWLESPAVSIYEPTLGGRYIVERFQTSFHDQPFEGLQCIGYDKLNDRYVATWMDTMTTWPTTTHGTADTDGNLEFRGTVHDPKTPDGRPFRMTWTTVDENTMVVEMYDWANGEEFQMMTITSRRRQ